MAAHGAQLAKETCSILDRGQYSLNGQRVTAREPAARGSVLAEPPPFTTTNSERATDRMVLDCGSFEAARRLLERGCKRVAVLDFASDSEPGGGWRGNQQGTQEESLCRASSLGRALEKLPYPIPTYGMAVVPEVLVLRDERGGLLAQPFVVGAIAAALRECGGDGSHLRKKAEGVCACAAALGYDGLVLGSWGCGAFGNDVRDVCAAFAQALRGRFAGAFAAVAFADPRNAPARAAFAQAMGLSAAAGDGQAAAHALVPKRNLSDVYGAGASSYDEAELAEWNAAGEAAAAAVRGKNWREAAAQFKACTERRPDHARGHICLARAHEKLGEPERALAALREGQAQLGSNGRGQAQLQAELASYTHRATAVEAFS